MLGKLYGEIKDSRDIFILIVRELLIVIPLFDLALHSVKFYGFVLEFAGAKNQQFWIDLSVCGAFPRPFKCVFWSNRTKVRRGIGLQIFIADSFFFFFSITIKKRKAIYISSVSLIFGMGIARLVFQEGFLCHYSLGEEQVIYWSCDCWASCSSNRNPYLPFSDPFFSSLAQYAPPSMYEVSFQTCCTQFSWFFLFFFFARARPLLPGN